MNPRSVKASASARRGGIMKAAIGLLAFVSAAGALSWMLLMPSALKVEVETRTGFPVEVGSLASNPLGFSLEGKDIEIGNPSAFGGGPAMLQIRRIQAEAGLPALGRGEIWIEDLELELSKARIVSDESGRLNLDVFLERLFANEEGGGPMPFRAARTRLVVDEIEFVDLSRPIAAVRSVRPLLDVEVRDAQTPAAMLGPIVELGRRLGALPGPAAADSAASGGAQ